MMGRRLFGNPDEAFLQSKPKRGLITQAEVRAIALAMLDIGPTSMVWDIGAGSGSVAIEAAQIASGGRVYAIEMDPEDYALDRQQRRAVRRPQSHADPGQSARSLGRPAPPDAVFVGGTGRQVRRIVELAFEQLRAGGRLVANVGSIENLAAVREVLQSQSRRRPSADDQPRPRQRPARAAALRGPASDVSGSAVK